MTDDLMRILASWALVHELADDAWTEAVARGGAERSAGMEAGDDAVIDGIAAMVAEEKDRLRAQLASGRGVSSDPQSEALAEVRFEIGELRGRLEAMETSLDAIARKLDASG